MNIGQIFHVVPWWVFLLAFLIFKMGMRATKPQVVPLKKLYTAPALLVLLALDNLWGQIVSGHANILAWLIGSVFGGWSGWKVALSMALEFDHDKRLVKLPGSWSVVAIMLIVIGGKVIVGYETSLNQGAAATSLLMSVVFIVSGFCTGILIGRAAGYFRQFSKSKSVSLQETR